MENKNIELKKAVDTHLAFVQYRDNAYINMIQQINTKTAAILKDDMGSQFIHNCGRDLAGEVVRNFFDTSDYNITVDQLATRILKFTYEDEYDPLANNGNSEMIMKNVHNYNELSSSTLDRISDDIDSHQAQLFPEGRETDKLDRDGKRAYRNSKMDADGNLTDELTNRPGTKKVIKQNGKDVIKSDLQADHIQAREAARYNSKYITHDGVQALREFWHSADNMQLMHASANSSKGDARVCEVNGEIVYSGGAEWRNMTDELNSDGTPTGNKIDKNGNVVKDISHKATPQQLAEATIRQWEKGDADSAKIQKLLEQGYLQKDENGNITVPKSVRKALEHNIRHSQNKESTIILKNTDYSKVAKDAANETKKSIGKIIAGQIIYYAAPPLVYEIRCMLKNKKTTLDDVIKNLVESAKRVGAYVLSKIKDIFKNVIFNSLKKFIKTFMDILIKTVKATIQKLLKIAKNLVLSTVDAIRIIADKNTSAAEKADSVFSLFGVTITSCIIEVIFEIAQESLHIPAPFDDIIFGPLQILVTIICTNLTMLILQKADLFDVRFGFKINKIKEVFAEERTRYIEDVQIAEQVANTQIDDIINSAKEESLRIYNELQELNPKTQYARGQLESINRMFSMNINFDEEWLKFIGMDGILATAEG